MSMRPITFTYMSYLLTSNYGCRDEALNVHTLSSTEEIDSFNITRLSINFTQIRMTLMLSMKLSIVPISGRIKAMQLGKRSKHEEI